MSREYIDEIKAYLFNYFESVLDNDFCNVIYDSETDPKFSAVSAANHLICYIAFMKHCGEEIKFDSIESFLKSSHYSDDEYEKFKILYTKELEYYVGKVFHEDE